MSTKPPITAGMQSFNPLAIKAPQLHGAGVAPRQGGALQHGSRGGGQIDVAQGARDGPRFRPGGWWRYGCHRVAGCGMG